jgi:hypothetical protein
MNLKYIRAYLAVCCLVVVLQSLRGLAQQNSDAAKTVSQPPATERDGQHDFDFELGTWKIHLKRLLHPLTGSTTWVEFDGTSVARKVWDGRAELEEFETDSPASAGQQGQDQKHHERDLFSRDQVGMDGEESNHERSPERETTESTRCSDAGRDHGISQETARSTPHDDRVGRFHGVAPRRTDRASVAGRGFRKPHLTHPAVGSGDGGRCAENGSFSERCSAGCTNGRVAVGMETSFSARRSKRLGIRVAAYERPTAVLA